MGLLDGKVVVVTGAGGGLGRAYALACASEGAAVLVNDVGTSRDGTGRSVEPAQAVVEEIRRAGGKAAENADSVATTEGAEAIVRAALDAFGRIDALVNNAGILRDKTLLKMDDPQWDAVVAVHLRGTFACSRAAARVMAERGGGAIVNVASPAWKGNFGQTNYSAAKAGIVGFSLSAALELAKHNIRVNVIAPLAKTRMTADVDSVPAEYTPEQVAPLVVYLVSDLSRDVTGRIFGMHGSHLFEYRIEVTEGRKREGLWTPSEIHAHLTAPAAAPVPAAPVSPLGDFFERLPNVFDPKGRTWNAVMHFVVAGAGDWTLEIQDGRASVTPGRRGEPTCVVTLDAATLAGMIDGKVSADMAFLQGKIKATNLQDLGKFGKAFDLKKLRQAASPPAGGGPPARAAGNVLPLIEALPHKFQPEKAAGWNGAIQFEAGPVEAVVEIKAGACHFRPGRNPSPALTVRTDEATLAGVLRGEIDPSRAIAEKKLSVSNPIAWMKVRQCFRFEPDRGLNRALIGKVYRAPALLVRSEWLEAYGTVVGDPESPVFPVRLVKPLFLSLIGDPDFNGDLTRMVHGEQTFEYAERLEPGMLVSPRARVLSIEPKSTGEVLHFHQTIWCEGRPVVRLESRLFFRSEAPSSKTSAPKTSAPSPERPPPDLVRTVPTAADLPRRYAEVSGDDNPIHLDDAFARSVGFRGVILHGLCTLALAAAALREGRLVRRLSVRFSRPAYPGEPLTIHAWRRDRGLAFDALAPSGDRVLTEGRLDFFPAAADRRPDPSGDETR